MPQDDRKEAHTKSVEDCYPKTEKPQSASFRDFSKETILNEFINISKRMDFRHLYLKNK